MRALPFFWMLPVATLKWPAMRS